MKYFTIVFCLLVEQILGDTLQSRLIASEIEDAKDLDKNTVAFINSFKIILCTGSFIHSSWILTSALCATKINFNTRYLVNDKLTENYENAYILYDIRPHEKFNPITMENDIGLVQVAPKSVKVNLIPKTAKILTDTYVTVRGLGISGYGGTPATKLREKIVVIKDNRQFCLKFGVMPTNTICSAFSLACLGDTGGPLLENDIIWGVISTNDDDAIMCMVSLTRPKPRTVYTLVYPYRAWITKTTGINF